MRQLNFLLVLVKAYKNIFLKKTDPVGKETFPPGSAVNDLSILIKGFDIR